MLIAHLARKDDSCSHVGLHRGATQVEAATLYLGGSLRGVIIDLWEPWKNRRSITASKKTGLSHFRLFSDNFVKKIRSRRPYRRLSWASIRGPIGILGLLNAWCICLVKVPSVISWAYARVRNGVYRVYRHDPATENPRRAHATVAVPADDDRDASIRATQWTKSREMAADLRCSWIVFAYSFHFGKSGFSACFSRQIRISGFYPDFFVQVRIGPYILFSNCMWRRRCKPTDENKNAVMSKRLRDGVMCVRLRIHSKWMMKTHWRAGSWSWSWLGLLFEQLILTMTLWAAAWP